MTTEELAYYKWEQAGKPIGEDKKFWRAAESEIRDGHRTYIKPQIQQHSWCFPTTISMLTGIPVTQLIDETGRNGLEEHKGHMFGFADSEMALVLLKHGIALVYIDVAIEFRIGNSFVRCPNYPEIHQLMFWVRQQEHPTYIIIELYNGVSHAIAWDTQNEIIVDPADGIINTFNKHYAIKSFGMLVKFK